MYVQCNHEIHKDFVKDFGKKRKLTEHIKENSRMASSLPDFASTQENTNYARLCRLLVDVGCTVLRDTFDSIHSPANLHVVLSSPSVFSTLQSLRNKKVLNSLQWGKLFPAVASSVSSANFDVTLLMVLLRNICGLSPPVSTGSWDELPPDSDNSTEANIVRIKWYRNDVYGHATKASVDDATFSALWQKISSAVLALGSGYGAVITRLKTECMDPAAEAHYQKLLSDWKKDDDILKELHERTHDALGEIKEKQQKTYNELGEMKENQERANFELGEVKDDEKNLNRQEELFVEDPQNAHLFDVEKEPQNGTKRTTDGPVSSAKRKKEDKPEKDECNHEIHKDFVKDFGKKRKLTEHIKENSRMASSLPDFASTQENTNYARLCRLLVDVGCTVLRDTFDSIHSPANLHVVLSSPSVFSTLQSLRNKKVLNSLQWGKLFPAVASSVSSANFDVTLLMVLLRNICGLSPPVSTGSWDELPPDSDNSTEANIVRIKWYRNDVYGHATKASVDDATFSALWQKISSAVLALGSGYGAVITRLKTECMDPAAEAHYQKLLSDWKKDDDILKELHERTHDALGEIKEKQQKTYNELGEMKEMIKQQQLQERITKESLKDKQDPFDIVKYISIIRQLYEDREGWLAPFPWCEEFRFNLDNLFTRLKFVSRKRERGIKTDVIVDMFQIFQPHQECSRPKRVLIEGQPGMGKTTYCQKIAYDWAKKRKGGESFPDVTLVLLLKCRDINCGLWEAIDDQLLPREVNEEEKERFFTFIRNHQSKVLLVLDGLDELPRGQLSIYTDIIGGRVLPDSYIVVTARHEVGVKVRKCFHTLLEVEGFTKTDAEKFILRYFKEEHLAIKLLDKLNSDRTLRGLTRNPLNTALLCLLCEDFGGKFPESRTLLYLEIVECVLRRYRRKMKLPETKPDLLVLYEVELKQLGFIAVEGLHNDSMYFDESAFKGFSSNVKSNLGFLSVEAGRSKRRPSRSYAFLHKSFQEFFAALFHCCQLLDEEISVDSLVADCRYFQEFQQVLMFTSGLLAQKCEATAKALIAGIATQVNLGGNLLDERLYVAWNCINECKIEGTTFDKEMAQFFGAHLKLQRVDCEGLTKEDVAVCIETFKTNSTVTELVLHECNIDDAIAAELAGMLKENSTLTSLHLGRNRIGDIGADALAKGLKENSTLTLLYLHHNQIGNVGADALAKGLKENSTLTSLYLFHNQIGDVGTDALAKGLKENSTLTSLRLEHNQIGDVGADALAKGLKENSTLTSLYLDHNQIGDVGADALAKGLKENSTLTSLRLQHNQIGDVGADALAKGLKENSTLTSLYLDSNQIGDVGTDALAKGLKENSTLTSLYLFHNQIGDVGTDALAKGLKENSTLTSLRLEHNQIGDVGADALAKGLKENSTLTSLYLFHNQIGDVGTDALAKGLKENSTLTSLYLDHNQIGDVGADALAKGLKENSTLTSLYLDNNQIGDVGADALAKGLKENSTLTSLYLYDNQIGDVGADALAKGLKENLTLTSLHLSHNQIGDGGADALAKGLKENSTLTSLRLQHNQIGDVGADALAKGLKENSTLTSLYLDSNQIGDVGTDALAKALKENSTLTSLRLEHNQIGDVGADALAKGLKENLTLTSLRLQHNQIGDVGADALAKGLKENSTLTSLRLSHNQIGHGGADALAKVLKENSTLTVYLIPSIIQ
ncbi:protein NLRC3-like isoform X5 [Acropora muricata]|uniref:protein NLRC3-like isoform X5 n=1 Tax=Acropora muricata TaxID=159855 RepID=UPI0034E49736